MSLSDSPPRFDEEVAAALAAARSALAEPGREPEGTLAVIARRLLVPGAPRSEGFDASLRSWFSPLRRVPRELYEAPTPGELLAAGQDSVRPRALELYDLLALLQGHELKAKGQAAEIWVLLDQGGGGLALRLRATRVARPAGLAADARLHAFASRDAAYRYAEWAADRVLGERNPGAAIRYSLTTSAGAPYRESITDASLGAALATVALEAAQPRLAFQIDSRVAITGAITSDGGIGAVDPAGLEAKAQAARQTGARALVVPGGQALSSPALAGVRVREARTVAEARSAARIVRRAVKVAALSLIALIALGGVTVHELRGAQQRDRQRHLAAERAVDLALELTEDRPRAALALAGAAGMLAPEETAAARSLIAVSLPPGVRYLPDLPATATALVWTEDGILAATPTRLFALDRIGADWRARKRLPAHSLAAFGETGRWLVLGGRRGAFRLDLQDGGRELLTRAPVRGVAAAQGAAALTRSGQVFVWDRGAGVRRIPPPRPVTAIAFAGPLELVAGNRSGRVLRLRGDAWADEAKGRKLTISPPRVAALAAAGPHVVAADPQGAVFDRRPLRLDAVGETATPASHLLALPRDRAVVVRPGAAVEVVVTDDNYLRVRVEQRLAGRFAAAAISPDGRRLLAAGREAAVLRLDTSYPSPAILTTAIGFDRMERPLGMDNLFGGLLRLHRERQPDLLVEGIDDGEVGAPVVSPNGRWAAQLQSGQRLRRFDLRTGTVRVVEIEPPDETDSIDGVFQHMGLLDDGRVAVSESSDGDFEGTTFLFDPSLERSEDEVYPDSGPFARSLPEGRLLLARGDRVDLLRTDGMELLASVTVDGADVNTLAASVDGEIVFLGGSSGDVWLWRPRQGDELRRLTQVDGSPRSLVSNDDGSVLFGTAYRNARTHSRLFAIDVERARTALLEAPEAAGGSTAALTPDGREVAFSSSAPVGIELLSARLTPREACRRAGQRVPPQIWQEAAGELDVDLPRCPG